MRSSFPPGRAGGCRIPDRAESSILAAFRAVLFVGLLAGAATGCGEPPPQSGGRLSVDSASSAAADTTVGRSYERALAFTTLGSPAPEDSALVLPILFTARATPAGVARTLRGWISREGEWEPFADEGWRTEPSPTPWRILPSGPIRLVVGDGGAVEAVLFRRPPRTLDLDLGEELAVWTGADGSTFRLVRSTVLLGTREFGGVTLDMARARDAGEPPGGDWAFLVSGDSVQIVLESRVRAPPDSPTAYRGFGRIDFRLLQWPEIVVEWSESRAFEPARRDVPSVWTLRTMGVGSGPDGRLQSTSGDLTVGPGEGAVLPVHALFAVEGRIRIGGSDYPVQGIIHHVQD